MPQKKPARSKMILPKNEKVVPKPVFRDESLAARKKLLAENLTARLTAETQIVDSEMKDEI